jgi:hypothetical protein
MRSRLLASGLFVAALFAPQALHAQTSPENKMLAESLFKDGRTLMDQGRTADACRKLEESQRLDPAPGTLINLAICHDKEGKIASAWGEYRQSLSFARRDNKADREQICNERIEALEPQLPRVTIDVPQDARIQGLEISRNGTNITDAAWGSALPSDPGEVVVEAKAPGRKKWRTTGRVERQGNLRIAVPVLAIDDTPPPKVAVETAVDTSAADGDSGKRIAGIATGAAGLVALGVGTYFGINAFSKKSESNDHCPNDVCDQQGVDAMDTARSNAVVANVALGVGIVAVGVGTWLFISGQGHGEEKPAEAQAAVAKPAPARISALRVLPSVGPQGGGAFLSGQF